MKNVAFIGVGNMAGAMVTGLSQGVSEISITLFDIDRPKAEAKAKEAKADLAENLQEACTNKDAVILAVKPVHMTALLKEITPFIKQDQLVITVAAGILLEKYQAALPQAHIIRAMPNTSARVLAGVSGLMAGTTATQADKTLTETIFNSFGISLWLEEKDIDALIAVSGSGPAYYYYFTECIAQAGIKLGLNPETAAKLARGTAIGAGKMLEANSESPETLRIQVTSPNGTTAQAIESFEKSLPQAVLAAMTACAKRSKEMSK